MVGGGVVVPWPCDHEGAKEVHHCPEEEEEGEACCSLTFW